MMVPTASARARLKSRVDTSKRGGSVQFPMGFVRSSDWNPPAAQMLRGGTLRAYLVLMMAATKPPHGITIPPSELAELLDLPNPDRNGKRRVADILRRLQKNESLLRDLRPGRTTVTQILDPAGTGQPWSSKHLEKPWLTVPIGFWSHAWLLALSPAATSVLIALCELTQSRSLPTAFAEGGRKREYGLSPDTWTRGTKELTDRGVVSVESKVLAHHGQPRQRKLYTLDRSALDRDP